MEETVKKQSGLSTVGLVLGILALVFSFIPIIRFVSYPLGAIGAIFGLVCVIGKKSMGKAIVALILGVLAIVLTVVMQKQTVKAVNKAVDDINKSAEELSQTLDDASGKNTEDILKNELDVSIGEFKVTKEDYLTSYELPVTIKNKGKDTSSFSIKIEAVDSEGNRIDEDTIYVDSLNAGQTKEEKAFTLITEDKGNKLKTATFKIIEVSKY